MSSKKQKFLSPEQQKYQMIAQAREPRRPVLLNSIRAFLVGGIICTIGQFFQFIYTTYFNFTEVSASNPTVASLVIIAVLMTGVGLYDHLAQFAGGGTIVPVTGFANTMASSAIEHRSEGFVLGVGGNMFKIAGPVITYGVFSAFVVAIIRFIILELGGM
ncbi:MAG: stage V sporulation protein AC [Candidatus Syntrophonatronum acetioxidans]|uniref:Stage V sporulation protein AC n=1 Tax=Candidatus Syntrophonatronum acetioxidans TaxID=1795816 RepID=A0A424Y9C5_9FIRM|nr:MAG: stage V sporulation protein AC [Candidatus Syntrophonatronum acetioxidans]